MISRIEGDLVSMSGGRAELRCGPITHELLIPAADESHLSGFLGQTVGFHTLHYLEVQGQGATYIPRLIGFRSAQDRAFFELFTTVKGLGARKALRALQVPFQTVAEAIAGKDIDMLVSLPEIGKRTAETIVAELRGKVDRFVEPKPVGVEGGTPAALSGRSALIHDAVTVLTMLGEPKVRARQLVDRALDADSTIDSADALVAAAYRHQERG